MIEAQAAAPALNPALCLIYSASTTCPEPPVPELAQKMLELFDGARSVGEVCADVQIPEAKGLAVVRKLSSLGLIAPHHEDDALSSESPLARMETLRDLPRITESATFSTAEEAFFASEVLAEEETPARSLGERVSLYVSDLVLRIRGVAL